MAEDPSGPPKLAEFSKEAVRNAVLSEALTHPATLYPWVLGVLSGLGWLLLGVPIMLPVSAGLLLFGITGLIVNFFFRDKVLGEKYVQTLVKERAEREERTLRDLQEGLKRYIGLQGAEEHAQQAVAQFEKIKDKYKGITALLDRKIGSGDLDLGRVWGASEQVYLGVLDNLNQVLGLLDSVAGIDVPYVYDRLRKLSKIKKPTKADTREVETLKKRLNLREEQLQKINHLLTKNEEALTQIEEAAADLAAACAGDRFTDVDTEISVDRLREAAGKMTKQQG